jgi:hypothetical protein
MLLSVTHYGQSPEPSLFRVNMGRRERLQGSGDVLKGPFVTLGLNPPMFFPQQPARRVKPALRAGA